MLIAKGVKIYSTSLKRIITFVTKDHDVHLRDELYRCSLLWYQQDCLVIGWADRFKICKVIRRYLVNIFSLLVALFYSLLCLNISTRNNFSNLAMPQANQQNTITSIAANVLSSGAGSFSAHDKRDIGTYVEISKSGFIPGKCQPI